jgi:hypothetical protein
MKYLLNLTSLLAIIFAVGCGGSPEGFDPNAALETTASQLKTEQFAIGDIDYSDVSNTAITNLQPTAGMPFEISGTATLKANMPLFTEASISKASRKINPHTSHSLMR